MHRIYLDHNATTPVAPEVLAAMLPYFSEHYGNAGSIHSFGQRAHGAVQHAREVVAALLGARASEIVFTSGGTESDNAALFGVEAQGHIVTATIEHHAVLHACQALERRGNAVTYVSVRRDGVVDPSDIRRALRPATRLVSVMHANNETGAIQPIAEIAAIAAEAGVRFHTDAVQSAGKVPIDVNTLHADLLSISGHKFGAPKGVGALFIRGKTHFEPLFHGGPSERGRRAGTENVPGIVGLGKAAELAMARFAQQALSSAPESISDSSSQTLASGIGLLRDRLERGLLERIPNTSVNGGAAPRTPNTSNLTFAAVDSEALVIALDLQGLACSAGAACSSGAVDPSHVLLAMGLTPAEARASIRLSLGPATTVQDVDRALDLITEAVARQREISAAWPGVRRGLVPVS